MLVPDKCSFPALAKSTHCLIAPPNSHDYLRHGDSYAQERLLTHVSYTSHRKPAIQWVCTDRMNETLLMPPILSSRKRVKLTPQRVCT